MAGHGGPVDVARLVLEKLLGEERQDGYRLLRELQNFALVCRTWREAVATTPLRLNLDYLPELKKAAVRWLLKATFADLQVHPNFNVNRLLTNPDFAQRNRTTLQRLWGVQLLAQPGRWPQWRHFPHLHTLELNCDSHAMLVGQAQLFESRVLAPLTQLKTLSLAQFGGADLTRLPLSLETLHLDVDTALPLALPPSLRLQELAISTRRLLVDWAQLCAQVQRRLVVEAPCIDMLAGSAAVTIFRHAAEGFKQGSVAEMEFIGQEVSLVRLPGGLPRHISEEAYQAEVLEIVHLVTLAADFQAHDYAAFGCTYNPDDLQADEELGMSDGMTVKLFRHLPARPQVLGFSYSLSDEQLSYLVSEPQVEGLALEAVDAGEVARILNDREFQQRSTTTLRWLQGFDLAPELQLNVFPALEHLEAYFTQGMVSTAAFRLLPPSLTSLDLCGVSREESNPAHRDSWPDFDAGQGEAGAPSIACLTQLKELSLRHFRDIDLSQGVPASVEVITIECPRPLPTTHGPPPEAPLGCTCPACLDRFSDQQLAELRYAERINLVLPPLTPGQQRTLNIQLHASDDYYARRPLLFLSQLLGRATKVVIQVAADPPPPHSGEDEGMEVEGEQEEGEGGEVEHDGLHGEGEGNGGPLALLGAAELVNGVLAHAQGGADAGMDSSSESGVDEPSVRRPALLLAAEQDTLAEALEALTASPLESIEVEAARVLFTDGRGASFTDARRMLAFIRERYRATWLVWSHDLPHPDEGMDEDEGQAHTPWGHADGGFTMKRK